MNSYCLIWLGFLTVGFNCFKLNGKEYRTEHRIDGTLSVRTVYRKTPAPAEWVARCAYNRTYLKTGWDTLEIETNPHIDDSEQAFVAGYLEGSETQAALYDHYQNTVQPFCVNDTESCEKINDFLDSNTQWVKQMAQKHGDSDSYWHQVSLFYSQMAGMAHGYSHIAESGKQLGLRDIMWMNFIWDISDINSALKNETNRALKGNSHCSALIKLLKQNSDILIAHNTWTGFETMRRIAKRYTLRFHQVIGESISFPGYPGTLVSGDDFYITTSGLVAQETTNDNNNASLWSMVKPEGQVLEVIRAVVANRLANDGHSWTKIFSQYNSGTYNNQWMIVDLNKFSPGSIKAGLLWVAEQIPGYIRREDQTQVLASKGYWASYNRPFYNDIFNLMGNRELVQKYGDFFTYEKTARALLFKRDQEKVVNTQTMMQLMRSNDFQHDPLSRCNCTPPYSAENAIAARNDLNLANGTYPFPALSHRHSGATDAKVTSHSLARQLSFLAVSGPTTGAHLPPFQWTKSDFNNQVPHHGHPDLFNFNPILISWSNQH